MSVDCEARSTSPSRTGRVREVDGSVVVPRLDRQRSGHAVLPATYVSENVDARPSQDDVSARTVLHG